MTTDFQLQEAITHTLNQPLRAPRKDVRATSSLCKPTWDKEFLSLAKLRRELKLTDSQCEKLKRAGVLVPDGHSKGCVAILFKRSNLPKFRAAVEKFMKAKPAR